MRQESPLAVLKSLPPGKQLSIREWMGECGVADADLTLPLLRLLGGAIGIDDSGMQGLLKAMIAQEFVAGSRYTWIEPGCPHTLH